MLPITKPSIGREVAFFNSGRNPTRLGFGCAGLMQVTSRRGRQRLLAEAFEQGIRHFDIARMYGLGVAEGELGRFAQGRWDQMTIATKFGIDPSGAAGRLATLQAPARALLSRFPALRAALKRRQSSFNEPRRYDAATARRSLERSLRALGTEYVDLYFVHDPAPGESIEAVELREALEALREAGLIRAWGISGEPEPCASLARAMGGRAALQVRDEITDRAPLPDGAEWPPITFGVLSGPLRRILDHLSADEERRNRWSRAVGADCLNPNFLASLLMRDALAHNPEGTVLFGTTRAAAVKIASAAAEAFSQESDPASLRAFRKRVEAELGGGRQAAL